ncbi:MAG TPA: hypothetical protein VFJ85_18435 [Acidimicrobiales bacterium]|nr:hypothetical protein [Acidimicrobiales bacterium]
MEWMGSAGNVEVRRARLLAAAEGRRLTQVARHRSGGGAVRRGAWTSRLQDLRVRPERTRPATEGGTAPVPASC